MSIIPFGEIYEGDIKLSIISVEDLDYLAQEILSLKKSFFENAIKNLLQYKWLVGKAILGSRVNQANTFRELEKKTGIDHVELVRCTQFYEKFPEGSYPQLAWREIVKALGIHEEEKPFSPQLFNVWSFAGLDDNFGQAIEDFRGRIPGQIMQNILWHYGPREEGLVVDPMSGTGTTRDVVAWWNNKYDARLVCLSYDSEPTRLLDIKEHDITTGYPQEAQGCDLIFLDPPYFDMVFTDLYDDVESFYNFIIKLAKDSYETVKQGGNVAFLMEDMTEKGSYCLTGESYRLFRDVGFICIDHISCPLSTEQFLPQQVEKAKEDKHLLGRNRDLYIFRK